MKCPLAIANDIFTIEDGKSFLCPFCEQQLVECAADGAELSSASAEFREDLPIRSGFAEEASRGPRPKGDWPFQIDFSNIQASEEFLRDDRLAETSQSSRQDAPAIRTFDASEHASWSENVKDSQTDKFKAGKTDAPAAKAEAVVAKAESPEQKVESAVESGSEEAMFKSFSQPPRERVPLFVLLIVIFLGLLLAAGVVAISKRWIVLPGLSLGENAGPKTILRLTGSNMIGDTLMPALAEAFLKAQGATNVHTITGEKPEERAVQGIMPGDTALSAIVISAQSSARGFTALAENSSDIGMTTRRINPQEEAALKALGDAVSPENEHILGLNGIAVLVNPSNPIRELPEDKIIKILTGETTKWSSVGSSSGAIKVYALDDKSGSKDSFNSLLLGSKILTPMAQRQESSEAVSDAISSDPNGIGVVGLSFVRNAKVLAVSGQDTQALMPNRLTVATEEYLFTKRIYLYTHGASHGAGANKLTQSFLAFALSKPGQDLVAANGFVSEIPAIETATVSPNAPPELRRYATRARRVSVDFRFPENPEEPDSNAQADMDRVASAIADLHIEGKNLMLFGFSDNGASSQENLARSLAGAKMLEARLVTRGVTPATVKGFGPILPVAPNNTEEGRKKNRRVEIWVKE